MCVFALDGLAVRRALPMFSKVDVNEPNTHPLFAKLKSAEKGLLISRT